MRIPRNSITDNECEMSCVSQEDAAERKRGWTDFCALEDIGLGHKIAVEAVAQGGLVRKYGVPIGRASAPIAAGAVVHTHNLEDITDA